ncbi:MAG TPA: BatA domain-containing protein, partial [Candidatus Polarisedimenticolia bacterium]|nr:BatA domain-containing protein [Candidatus Polarisedimenticolia bacterium]
MSGLHFGNPIGGVLLGLLLLALLWRVARARGRHASLVFSVTRPFRTIPAGRGVRLRHVPTGLRMLGLALLVIAFARPQTWFS